MDWNTFLAETVGGIVAGVPQLIIIASMVAVNLKQIRNPVEAFPEAVEGMKLQLTGTFKDVEKEMVESFSDARDQTLKMVNESVVQTKEILTEAVQELEGKVNDSLVSMQNELNSFNKGLTEAKMQSNLLLRQNIAYMDALAKACAVDPVMIRNEVTKMIADTSSLTKAELQKYPEALITNIESLKLSLEEFVSVESEQVVDEFFAGLGYERKNL